MLKNLFIISFLLLLSTFAVAQKALPQLAPAIEKSNVRFFPNPATSIITFEFNLAVDKGYTLQVYSFLGKKITTIPVVGSRVAFNVSELYRGVYVFQLRDATGRIMVTNKFQVNR